MRQILPLRVKNKVYNKEGVGKCTTVEACAKRSHERRFSTLGKPGKLKRTPSIILCIGAPPYMRLLVISSIPSHNSVLLGL